MAFEVTGPELVPPNVPLSVQLYTIRKHLPHGLASSLDRLKQLGFQGVEPFDFVNNAASYKAAANASGLTIPTAHAKLIDTDLDQIIDAASQLGIHTIIHPGALPEQWSTRATIEALAASLNMAAAKAAQADVAVAYHNHWWEFGALDGAPRFDLFVSGLDPRVKLQIDTYWVEVAKASAVDVLRRHADRVVSIHLKDGPINFDNNQHVAVGFGQMPVPEIVQAARQALHVVELDGYSGIDIFDPLRDSVTYLRGRRRMT